MKFRGLISSFRPVTLDGLLDIKAEHNQAKLIVGNTEVGIEMKIKSMAYPHLIGTTHVEEMNVIKVDTKFLFPELPISNCPSNKTLQIAEIHS